MNLLKTSFLITLIGLAQISYARYPGERPKITNEKPTLSTRSDCVQGTSRIDLDINNVRAALLSSGDVWWDLTNGVYVVPKVIPGTGVKPVSSIFAGAVWLGGRDPNGNLKVACQTYRDATRTDFWPGPLDDRNGVTNSATCQKWDKHFIVNASDVDSLKRLVAAARAANPNNPNPQVDCALIPENLKGYPAVGNPYFFDVHRFILPRTTQGLAPFFDADGDGAYDPCKGDHPKVDIKKCENIVAVPDRMFFWIYNDNGNVHTNSQRSTPIQMEVQVQAFGYQTNDELNDMTFYRFKLINRARTDIDSTFFAMWVDADLGCYTDDYIGCDTSRNLMYIYNQDALDGTNGTVCDGGVNTYGDKIPILGVDYFRGPNNERGEEIGMSSFTYYLNSGVCSPLPATTDPNTATEYYNYLTGKWRDGTPFSFGGNAYNPGSTRLIKYAFVEAPNNPTGWSMCTAALPCGDRRTIQASGPFRLKPGAINELIVGVPWVADQDYPCPDIRRIQEADDIAQALFDNCFKIFDGPDAPDLNFIELDREIIVVLSNAPESNNATENYFEKGLKIPAKESDSLYRFQGYKVYQLRDGDVGVADLDNPEKSRLVAQVDIQDGVAKLYNWSSQPDPNFPGRTVHIPVLKVEGENKGIRHTFSIKDDKFARGDDKRLINHKKYYFIAIAYAHNNYKAFDEDFNGGSGQKEPYVVGRRNIGDKRRGGKAYEVLPRPITDVQLNSKYGDGVVITRLDGVGNGGNFLDISAETLQKILSGQFDGTITYKPGAGPIQVKVYNPLEVIDGQYELTMRDRNMNDDVLDDTARWALKLVGSNDNILSDRTIQRLNEQIIAKYGFSVTIKQAIDPGRATTSDVTNGAIGARISYADVRQRPWLTGIKDDDPYITIDPTDGSPFNFIKNQINENDFDLDPKQGLSSMSPLFYPYYLCDYRFSATTNQPAFLISPAWQNASGGSVRTNNSLANLNNVDIVLTKDKTKWSRCVVVETAAPFYTDNSNPNLRHPAVGNAKMFDLRRSPSVSKDADAADPNKPTGQVLPDEQAAGLVQGMGWFPGYAIDVETGKRLNIFFGENSSFDPALGIYQGTSRGANRDMIWNPTSQVILQTPVGFEPAYAAFYGGQQFIYVTNTEYDSCKLYRDRFTGTALRKITALRTVTWAAMPFLTTGSNLLSYREGLIPNDVTVKLRVNNGYNVARGKGTNNSHPSYTFELRGRQAAQLTPTQVDSALSLINVVPNPYYGYSAYETNEFSTTVKITNLPAKATITVYTLDGKFIRQFKRDEKPTVLPSRENPGVRVKQIVPDIEWDMKNDKGIPVASGVYLIHIAADGAGERTLKFFAINRQFDPSRL